MAENTIWMEKILKLLSRNWWYPAMTTLVISFLTIFFLPTLALELMNSRSTLLVLTAVGVLSLPYIVSRIHNVSYLILAGGCYGIFGMGWFNRPDVFDGNPKLALASYLIPWMLISVLFVGVTASILYRKSLPR
jgi:hypothetical protein